MDTIAPSSAPTQRSKPVAPRWVGALAALIAAFAALAVGELVSGLIRTTTSPVVSVGEWVIDHVPPWVKEFAIRQFGTNDKPMLIAGTVVALAVFAVVIGVLAVRRLWIGLAGIALFGIIGVATAITRPAATLVAVLPALLGTLVAMAVLVVLLQASVSVFGHTFDESRGDAPADEPTTGATAARTNEVEDEDEGATGEPSKVVGTAPSGFDRRTFLVSAAVVAGGAVVIGEGGRLLQGRFDVGEARSALKLPAPTSTAAPLPVGVDMNTAGVTPFMTANADFYRVDTALDVPQVSPDDWELRIHGMVDKELTFSYQDLLDRDLIERNLTMVCVSNEVGGSYAGTARWLGVPLADLLREAGVHEGADQMVSRSVDGWSAGSPTATVMDGRDAMIALGMNGEPLPVVHGFPARIVVPGLYGYTSATKWLTEIELTTFAAFDAYWVERTWAQQATIKTLTRIDTPRGLSNAKAGKVAVGGVAWAIHRGITSVEVKIDEGPWMPAKLGEVPNNDTWRQWYFDWDATSGSHSITARATDGTGVVQTEDRANPIPDGASGWHSIIVLVD